MYNTNTTVTVRNAFSSSKGRNEARVDAAGNVRVYDSVAGYWTTCHSLTERQVARVLRAAAI